MSAASDTKAQTSSRIGTFSLVFGVSFAILYVVCDMGAFPMFTYHPGPDRFDMGFTPPRRDNTKLRQTSASRQIGRRR